ncbi:MAG: hypothetical protein ACTSPN_09310 [Promethearchaeota archaeon]
MKLIVDANILFSALIKDGLTAELLISDKLQCSKKRNYTVHG